MRVRFNSRSLSRSTTWLTFDTRRTVSALCLAVAVALAGGLCVSDPAVAARQDSATQLPVGRSAGGITYTPANQRLTPTGLQVDLPGMRPQALALSPDGTRLVTAGLTHELVVLSPVSGAILQRVPLPSLDAENAAVTPASPRFLNPDKDGQLSFTGLVFSPDGARLYLSDVRGSIKVFHVGDPLESGVIGHCAFPLPPANAPRREEEIPAGLACSSDGTKLYVCGNLSNQLFELDAASGSVLRSWPVGVAPFDVVIVGTRACVSNWGGRRPSATDLAGPAGRGTTVRVDALHHVASEGSVSIIDLEGVNTTRELVTGMHASALALSPDGNWLVVANTTADTLSVIDTHTLELTETIWTRQNPADLFGAQPTALAFDASGERLYVCNGTQNAVAVIEFEPGDSKLRGLIPVGWFPGAICLARNGSATTLCVANIKGLGSTKKFKDGEAVKLQSRQYYGTLSLIPLPSDDALPALSQLALDNMRYGLMSDAKLPPRADQPARAVPERVGEPSLFNHVVYIIKENRTYDQVFGDIAAGNGDASLCIFGEDITPNLHALARETVLLDNTYCSGILSADGHQWADAGVVTDYVERSFAGFPRSYPDGMELDGADALAYSPAGFIWDKVLSHGKSLRVFGEFAVTSKRWSDPTRKGTITASDCWKDFTTGEHAITVESTPSIPSLQGSLSTTAPGWDMDIPDVWRAREFITELRDWEKSGVMPNFTVICLPNDHTSGTSKGMPTPAASVADNDLAFGQIVEALSHSAFWKDTCVFAIEDDPQAGWDHVSGYRTTALVISPYSKRGAVVSTQYNQTSVLRTMELMLGLPPMNQFDATATPMRDCFSEVAVLTPFTALANRVPLDQMNPEPTAIRDPLLLEHALASSALPLEKLDQCPEDLLNRILWHAMRGSAAPYPEWAIAKNLEEEEEEAEVKAAEEALERDAAKARDAK